MNDALKDYAEPSCEELVDDGADRYIYEDNLCNAPVEVSPFDTIVDEITVTKSDLERVRKALGENK